MSFTNKFPEWKNEGTPPPENLQANGFEGGDKPPAAWLNWLCNIVGKCITELQSEFTTHKNDKTNPHSVTAAQVGLDKVNNTADSEKYVAFASEAGVGRKVENNLVVRLKGGSTEGADLFTYNGSTGKSINITPEKIGAAKDDLSNVDDEVFKEKVESNVTTGTPIVEATSTDGITYTANVENVTELYNGMEIIIIPNMTSKSKTTTLNVNGLGAVNVRQPLSFSTFVATAPTREGFLYGDTPCRLMYHANYASGGIWLMADKQKTSAQDLYGTVPVESGGTGVTDLADLVVGGANWAEWANHPAMHDCSNTDLNTLKTSGYYFGYTGMTNAAANEISVIEVIPYSGDWVLQRQTRLTDGQMYYRYFSSGSKWSDWNIIYTSQHNNNAQSKPTLLWENASPTSEFAPQTISVGWSAYSFILVEYCLSAELDGGRAKACALSSNGSPLYLYNVWNRVSYQRQVNFNDDEVSFGDAAKGNTYDTTSNANNKSIVPLKIWGIK